MILNLYVKPFGILETLNNLIYNKKRNIMKTSYYKLINYMYDHLLEENLKIKSNKVLDIQSIKSKNIYIEIYTLEIDKNDIDNFINRLGDYCNKGYQLHKYNDLIYDKKYNYIYCHLLNYYIDTEIYYIFKNIQEREYFYTIEMHINFELSKRALREDYINEILN